MRGHLGAYNANSHTLDSEAVTQFVTSQETVFAQFEQLADVQADADGVTNYRGVVDAGIHYVDVRCSGYMQAVFWLNRTKNASSQQTQLFGSTSAAALEVLNASRELIALTPLGFTLLNETINNVGDSLLFSLPPEAVGQLVEERQRAYVSGLANTYTNRATALRAIQGYVELCLSNNIEAAAIDAIASRRFEPEPTHTPTPSPTLSPTPTPDPTPTSTPEPLVEEVDRVPTIRGI